MGNLTRGCPTNLSHAVLIIDASSAPRELAAGIVCVAVPAFCFSSNEARSRYVHLDGRFVIENTREVSAVRRVQRCSLDSDKISSLSCSKLHDVTLKAGRIPQQLTSKSNSYPDVLDVKVR